MVMALI